MGTTTYLTGLKRINVATAEAGNCRRHLERRDGIVNIPYPDLFQRTRHIDHFGVVKDGAKSLYGSVSLPQAFLPVLLNKSTSDSSSVTQVWKAWVRENDAASRLFHEIRVRPGNSQRDGYGNHRTFENASMLLPPLALPTPGWALLKMQTRHLLPTSFHHSSSGSPSSPANSLNPLTGLYCGSIPRGIRRGRHVHSPPLACSLHNLRSSRGGSDCSRAQGRWPRLARVVHLFRGGAWRNSALPGFPSLRTDHLFSQRLSPPVERGVFPTSWEIPLLPRFYSSRSDVVSCDLWSWNTRRRWTSSVSRS